MLAINEVVDHAALNRAWAVQRIQCRQIFDSCWLVTPQDIAHAVRFKLENRGRVASREQLVGLGILQRQVVDLHLHAAILFDHLHRVMQHRQRRQPQKIHFQQADAFQRVHVKLRGDFVAVGFIYRNNLRQRLRRNHHACRMCRSVPRQPFQAQRHRHQIF